MAKLAMSGVAIAVSAALLGAVPHSAALAATPVQSAATFQSLANSDLLLSGPVDQVIAKSFQIRLLGQAVILPATQHQLATDGIIGRMVAVYGSVASNGSLKVSQVSLLNTEYVPGSTPLFIKGLVTSIDQVNAVAKLGSISISYSGALHTLVADEVALGKVVSFGGVEFAGSTKFFADNGVVATLVGQSGSDLAGQSGSDLVGQSGSDRVSASKVLGQSGSDLVGQSGSDRVSASKVLGQSGSDLAGQSGSDLVGQSGSDRVSASKVLGQSGSDLAGQSGSDLVGQSGSDRVSARKVLGQSGSDLAGQSGSD
jgi:hypothetical protein